jgi:uncharacterized protein YfiM (DUF2279 family)
LPIPAAWRILPSMTGSRPASASPEREPCERPRAPLGRRGHRLPRAPRLLGVLLVWWALQPVSAAARQAIPDPAAPLNPICVKGDGWISADKICHFAVSAAGTAGIYALAHHVGVPRVPAAIGSVVAVGLLGLARETVAFGKSDRLLTDEHFSWRDMAWNGGGIVVGLVVTDLWLGRRRRKQRQPGPD